MSSNSISVTCEKCNRAFKVKPAALGRTVKCPGCSHRVTVISEQTHESTSPPPPPTGTVPQRSGTNEDNFFDQIASLDLSDQNKRPQWTDEAAEFRPYEPPGQPASVNKASQMAMSEIGVEIRRYPALQVVQTILRVLAIVSLIIAGGILGLMLLSFVVSLSRVDSDATGFRLGFSLVSGLTTSAPFLLSALMLFSYAELIKVFLDIQENTQRTAHFLRSRIS